MKINNDLKKYSDETTVILLEHIKNVSERYNVKISIEDTLPLYSLSPKTEKALNNYLFHNNHFCNFVKHNKKCAAKCGYNKAATVEKCRNLQAPFFGTCYMGVSEYVFPVILNKRLISVIYAGMFCHSEYNKEKLDAAVREYKLPKDEVYSAYEKVVTKTIFSDRLISDINVMKKLISLLIIENTGDNRNYSNHSNTIINSAISFINENYSEELSLSLIASGCYCNPSYLSYIMKKEYGMTVTDYINMVRINNAKELISISKISLTEIAYKVGFNDLAYFSRVFKKITNITPSEYRKNSMLQ